jgi:hypothetical protein
MSYGLQIFDSGGAIILDTTDRLTILVNFYSVYISGTSAINIPVSGMLDDGTWSVLSLDGFGIYINTGYFTINPPTYPYTAYTMSILVFRC